MNDGIITENNKEQFKKLFENKNGKMLLDIDEIVLIASKHRSYEMLILGILNVTILAELPQSHMLREQQRYSVHRSRLCSLLCVDNHCNAS